jgi:steroid delta-isomerase-like uncharacterized protein
MASASIPIDTNEDTRSARIAIVEQHIRLENAHDLEGVLGTFGNTARYEDEAWGEHYDGAGGVRRFYEQLMKALPDLEIEVQRRHVTDDAIVMEVMIRGTHLGEWRGLPATGRRVEVPLCGVYTFDSADRLAGEKIYYDRGTVLRQLGVFHEPQSLKAYWVKSPLSRLIPSQLLALSRGNFFAGDTTASAAGPNLARAAARWESAFGNPAGRPNPA